MKSHMVPLQQALSICVSMWTKEGGQIHRWPLRTPLVLTLWVPILPAAMPTQPHRDSGAQWSLGAWQSRAVGFATTWEWRNAGHTFCWDGFWLRDTLSIWDKASSVFFEFLDIFFREAFLHADTNFSIYHRKTQIKMWNLVLPDTIKGKGKWETDTFVLVFSPWKCELSDSAGKICTRKELILGMEELTQPFWRCC